MPSFIYMYTVSMTFIGENDQGYYALQEIMESVDP